MDVKVYQNFFLAGIGVSLLSILPFDTGFYTFTRIVITICSVAGVIVLRQKNSSIWVVFGLLAILYNPIIPVYLNDKELWMIVNGLTAASFLWLFKYIGGNTSLVEKGLFWISRLGLLFCFVTPLMAYIVMSSNGERIYWDHFLPATLAFWGGGIFGALAINKVFFGQISLWVVKRGSIDSNDP